MYYSEKNQKIIFEEGDWVVEKSYVLSQGAFKLGEITGETGKNSNRCVTKDGRTVYLKNCRLANQDEIDVAMAKLAAAPKAAETDDVKELILALCRKKGWI